MTRIIAHVVLVCILGTALWLSGCGQQQQPAEGFNPETLKAPEKIANPAEGLRPPAEAPR